MERRRKAWRVMSEATRRRLVRRAAKDFQRWAKRRRQNSLSLERATV